LVPEITDKLDVVETKMQNTQPPLLMECLLLMVDLQWDLDFIKLLIMVDHMGVHMQPLPPKPIIMIGGQVNFISIVV
jgi:hypothetical protein